MTEHAMATTTHTAEMRQIDEMNAALSHGARLTAGSVGINHGTPGDALLRRLKAAGPPFYPYVFGVFTQGTSSDSRPQLVELHTAHLRNISDQLRLRGHIWGS